MGAGASKTQLRAKLEDLRGRLLAAGLGKDGGGAKKDVGNASSGGAPVKGFLTALGGGVASSSQGGPTRGKVADTLAERITERDKKLAEEDDKRRKKKRRRKRSRRRRRRSSDSSSSLSSSSASSSVPRAARTSAHAAAAALRKRPGHALKKMLKEMQSYLYACPILRRDHFLQTSLARGVCIV